MDRHSRSEEVALFESDQVAITVCGVSESIVVCSVAILQSSVAGDEQDDSFPFRVATPPGATLRRRSR